MSEDDRGNIYNNDKSKWDKGPKERQRLLN